MWLKLFGYCLLFLISTGVKAQLYITAEGDQINYSGAHIQYAFTPGNDFSNATLLGLNRNGWQKLVTGKIPISNTRNCAWIKIPINSLLKYGDFNFININNPHINYLQCWIVKKDSIIMKFKRTGDNIAFLTRPLPTTTFVYHINGKDYKNCDFVIATDKRYTKLDLPVNFCTETYYLKQNTARNLLMGLVIGVFLFLFVFNFYLFISVKQSLYLWYSLYLFMVALYLGTDMGQLFKYIYPDCPFLNDIIRPAAFAFSIVPQIKFFNELLEIPLKLPHINKFNNWLLTIYVLLFILAVTTSASGNYKIQSYWVYANRVVYPLVLLTIIIEAIYCLNKGFRYAVFAVISYLSFLVFVAIYLLLQNELIERNDFSSTSLYWGLFLEGMIMAFTLAWRFKFYKEDSERLLKENQLQQENIFRETALYQQKEMQRMSSLLHDTVGANLGFLRLETDNMPLTEAGRIKIAEDITRLGNEVRTMSHGFSPLVLQDKGLYLALAEMVKLIISNSKIDLQFEWLGSKEKISVQYEIIIYRIVQEILQNLLKHSQANTAFLQVIIEQKLVSIYAEDDGVGLNRNKASDGLGLKSLEDLVTLLKGNFSIDSGDNKGFSISIEFNQQNNENV